MSRRPSWTISAGALPEGLTLDENTGEVSGTPLSEGTSAFTVRLSGAGHTTTKDFTIHIVTDAFGVTFEVPVVVILLVLTNMVSVAKLREARPYVIVGAFVIGAIFTPPDVISQIMLAIPMWLLYELGILMAGFLSKVKPAQAPQVQEPQEASQPPSQQAPYPTYPSDYEPLTYEEMEAELDRIDAENKKKESDS